MIPLAVFHLFRVRVRRPATTLLLEPFHPILLSDFCEQKEQEKAASFDHCHHEAGLLQTQNGKKEDAPEKPSKEASEEVCSIEQPGCLA